MFFIRLPWVLLACLVFVQLVGCDDLDLGSGEEVSQESRSDDVGDQRRDGKTSVISGGARRTTTPSSANVTRDSQLLSVLAARRRQLLHGRLATHISTLASIANKSHKTNTTFAQLEVKDANNSIVKRITFENSSNAPAPTLQLVTTDGSKEIRQDLKPHEIRHLFVPKVYQDIKNRAGFLNNRRKDSANVTKTNTSQEILTDNNGAVYIPPEKLEGLDKELEVDPEEEFQVDESNHGLYLLNYSDTENVTINQIINTTFNSNDTKEISTPRVEVTTQSVPLSKENTSTEIQNSKIDQNINTNNNKTNVSNNIYDKNNITIKGESEKGSNTTLFMSDELYNHFRPLETELPAEDMAPFLYFGQKLAGQIINDNLTNSPSLSASTKSVNFIIASPERTRKFNSRYSATEKYLNSSVDEEEINEDMDVSVVKNIIEKNKIRNSVKGVAPARHVGLVNAYRKYTTVSTSKPPNIAQLNVTEPIISVTPATVDKNKLSNRTSSIFKSKDTLIKPNTTSNATDSASDSTNYVGNINKAPPKVNTTAATPRNYTRNYLNLRRRPAKVTAPNIDGSLPVLIINATTEKASTLVYTAVVTSVSITSSVKGQNNTASANGTVEESADISENSEIVPKSILINVTETTPAVQTVSSTTSKPHKHRIRIRTTTTESTVNTPSTPLVYVHRATDTPVTSELSTKNADLKQEATASRYSERLANLYGRPEVDNTTDSTSIKPKNILRRRRPTTTTTTTSSATTIPVAKVSSTTGKPSTVTVGLQSFAYTTTVPVTETSESPDVTENNFKPFVVTSRTSSESSSKPLFVQSTNSSHTNNSQIVPNLGKEESSREEVVIEAEKTYTASYVLAGLGFLPVAGIIIFVFRNVLNKKSKEIDTEYEGYFDDNNDIKKDSPIIPVARAPMPTPSKPDQKWEFPRNKLRLQTLLGQGNFGQVWKAEADDLTGHDGLTRLVAVKSIKETASQKEKQELLHEIFIMQKIGTHPNVVTLLACCTEQEPYLLVMEYVMCGKLLSYLRSRRAPPDRFSALGALSSRDLTVFAYCVARGMDYIASKGIVHRDLAARNVLVDHNKLCKIADFGMSRETTSGASGEERVRQRHALPVRWMAPEALLYNVYNHESDVWAYGILLWEIVTLGSTPYAAMSGREVLAAVTEGYRLERPPHCKPQLYRAMHSCWHSDPSQRPTFATIKSQLAELLDNEPVEGNYVDLDSFYQESSVYSDPSAIIQDEEGLSAEYDRERRVFRELASSTATYDNRGFTYRDEELRNTFSHGGHTGHGSATPRMGGFGIRDVPFSGDFADRQFTENTFTDRNFNDNFTERKDGKLSTSSFHRERERENPLVSRNSFSGFPRLGSRDNHFQLLSESRNKRVPEFECDI